MKKTIYRYIAIAFAVLALFVAYVEINVSGIPFFAFICALAAKQFYDDSNGRVYDKHPKYENSTKVVSPETSTTFGHSSSIHDQYYNNYYDASNSYARGEDPYTRGSINNFD